MKRPRLLLADDDTMVLEGLRKILEAEFDIVGMVGDGRALLAAAEKLQPDAILLDISMPFLNGLEAARHLQKSQPHIKLIFLTMHMDQTYAEEAIRAGASAYLLKFSAPWELFFAIRQTLAGAKYVTSHIASDLMQSWLRHQDETTVAPTMLSPAERKVLQLVAEGQSNKAIAGRLKLSIKNVESHKSRIMTKLNLHSTAELTKYALAHGITSLS